MTAPLRPADPQGKPSAKREDRIDPRFVARAAARAGAALPPSTAAATGLHGKSRVNGSAIVSGAAVKSASAAAGSPAAAARATPVVPSARDSAAPIGEPVAPRDGKPAPVGQPAARSARPAKSASAAAAQGAPPESQNPA